MAFSKTVRQKVLSIAAVLALGLCPNTGQSQPKLAWADSLIVHQAASSVTAPRIKFLGDGTALVAWGESSNPPKIWCSRLENGKFAAPVAVVTTTPSPLLFGFGGFDMALSGQKIYIVFERNGTGIFCSRSEDGGLTFQPPVQVQGPVSGGYATLASVAADESGNIFVDYILDKAGAATHQLRRSTDGGLSFAAPVEASLPADGAKVCECCTAAPLAANGKVWLAFRNNNSNIRDMWVSRSATLADSFDLATDVDDSDWLINICPISGPRMARMGDSLVTVWKSGAFGGSRVFATSLHAENMGLGQQIRLGDAAHFAETQDQPDITASGDTLGVAFTEGQRIAFGFSANGLAELADSYTHFEEAGKDLKYPAVTYREGAFHLVYYNLTTKQVIYRRGNLAPTSGATGAGPGRAEVSVFPNPSPGGGFWLKSEVGALRQCTMLDISGKEIARRTLSGRLQKIEPVGLPRGVYFLKIETEQGRSIQKWILN